MHMHTHTEGHTGQGQGQMCSMLTRGLGEADMNLPCSAVAAFLCSLWKCTRTTGQQSLNIKHICLCEQRWNEEFRRRVEMGVLCTHTPQQHYEASGHRVKGTGAVKGGNRVHVTWTQRHTLLCSGHRQPGQVITTTRLHSKDPMNSPEQGPERCSVHSYWEVS